MNKGSLIRLLTVHLACRMYAYLDSKNYGRDSFVKTLWYGPMVYMCEFVISIYILIFSQHVWNVVSIESGIELFWV